MSSSWVGFYFWGEFLFVGSVRAFVLYFGVILNGRIISIFFSFRVFVCFWLVVFIYVLRGREYVYSDFGVIIF